MTAIATSAVALANKIAPLPRGRGGRAETTFSPAQGQAISAANGNFVPDLADNGLLMFRTNTAAAVNMLVYADVNGVETLIDTVIVPGNATAGGVALYQPPYDVDWRNHNTTNAAVTGSLVFQASGAGVIASVINPNRAG